MSHTETHERSLLGFWIYLMTDLLSFGVLFATYAVLSPNTAGGPNAKELFSLPFVLIETLILLTSSFTVGLAMLAVFKQAKQQALIWFGVTFLLGLTFLGTHGLHISVGLLWMAVSMVMIWKRGLTPFINSKLTRLALFWHFLDIVWIFIFTIVYLLSYV